jgi:hypothetical protein
MLVHFTGAESTFSYFEATRGYLERYVKPLAFYSDKASIFRVNQPDAVKGPGITQFARALYELNEAYPDIQGVYYGSSMNGHAPAVALNERAHRAMRADEITVAQVFGPTMVQIITPHF